MKDLLQQTYGYIFEEKLIDDIVRVSLLKDFKEHDVLIDFGDYIKKMPLLISGAIKILREDFDEGELLLYFIEKGDTCAMTMTCCLGNKTSKIRATAENDGEMIMIPVQKNGRMVSKIPKLAFFCF